MNSDQLTFDFMQQPLAAVQGTVNPFVVLRPTVCGGPELPSRITWKQYGEIHRGRVIGFFVGHLWDVIITHGEDAFIGCHRFVEHGRVMYAKSSKHNNNNKNKDNK